jgi:hypothetical protein
MALLLPKRRQLLASLMGADIIMNSFVLEQMCLAATGEPDGGRHNNELIGS